MLGLLSGVLILSLSGRIIIVPRSVNLFDSKVYLGYAQTPVVSARVEPSKVGCRRIAGLPDDTAMFLVSRLFGQLCVTRLFAVGSTRDLVEWQRGSISVAYLACTYWSEHPVIKDVGVVHISSSECYPTQ